MKHVLTLALAVAFCGFTTPAFAAPNPCTLVKSSEAAHALGAAVLPAKPVSGGGSTECRYLNSSQDKNVLVQVYDDTSAFPTEALKMPAFKHIPQLGPKAIMAAGTIYMIEHGTYVTIGLYKGPNVIDNPALIQLGKLAASRM